LEQNIVKQSYREFTETDISNIQYVSQQFPKLSRHELAQTICEHLNWYSPSGAPKVKGCLDLLENLAKQKLVILPTKTKRGRKTSDSAPQFTQQTDVKPIMKGLLKTFAPIKLEIVDNKKDNRLWNEYIERYHPLKYHRPFGNWLRYFIFCNHEILGCIMMSGAARALRDRDNWIGWETISQQNNLNFVINNSRYLILPWVQIPHMASHVLGQLARRVVSDWEIKWGYRPVLMETFIDSKQYTGTCYLAAGWKNIGMTSGKGVVRPGKSYTTSPKHIFMKPLNKDYQTFLCSVPKQRNEGNE
jgi:hypothetical protein